jgi:hypothetical protein
MRSAIHARARFRFRAKPPGRAFFPFLFPEIEITGKAPVSSSLLFTPAQAPRAFTKSAGRDLRGRGL